MDEMDKVVFRNAELESDLSVHFTWDEWYCILYLGWRYFGRELEVGDQAAYYCNANLVLSCQFILIYIHTQASAMSAISHLREPSSIIIHHHHQHHQHHFWKFSSTLNIAFLLLHLLLPIREMDISRWMFPFFFFFFQCKDAPGDPRRIIDTNHTEARHPAFLLYITSTVCTWPWPIFDVLLL